MRIHPQCIPCLINRALYEANIFDETKAALVVSEATKILAELYNPEDPDVSARIASSVHARVYEILGTEDPYSEMKKLSNQAALALLPMAREMVSSSKDPLRTAALCSAAGNVLDFGIEGASSGPEQFMGQFKDIVTEGFAVDELHEAFSLLKPGSSVVYLTDNCGEIVFDQLLWEEMRKMGVRVVVVVKEKPILTDATMDDVEELGLYEKADRFLTTGTGVVGLEPSLLPAETEKEMRGADLILSKGMANFESLSEEDYLPILFIMRTKCQPIANHAHAPTDANVAKLYK
ncbi:MAG: ARMT1-like domain-containing protein [Candidatus Thermoplasmatota archaeon]|nr:ARMT1-like domain-containing protein [Candidatus Thermoplasmatota archaeon]